MFVWLICFVLFSSGVLVLVAYLLFCGFLCVLLVGLFCSGIMLFVVLQVVWFV